MLYELNLTKSLICSASGRILHGKGYVNSPVARTKRRNLFVCIIYGKMKLTIESREYEVSKGGIFIIPRDTPYRFSILEDCEYYYFHFNGIMKICDELPTLFYERTYCSMYSPVLLSKSIFIPEQIDLEEKYDEFVRRIKKTISLVAEPYHSSHMLFNADFLRILIKLSALLEPKSVTDDIPILLQKITDYIQKNLTSAITVSDISAIYGVSPSYIARLFRNWYNCSPTKYIQQEKMNFARSLISYGEMNVSEIADYLGYSNVYYFSRVYKNILGNSPTKDIRIE